MKEKLLQQTQHEYSPGKRSLLFIPAGILFLGLLPAGIIYFSARLDHRFGMPGLYFGVVNWIIGMVLMATGLLLGLWSNYVQFTIGRGTPVPVMATQKLLTQKPYSYCRNPMALGAILIYLGLAVVLGSISAAALVLIFAVVLLIYIKFLEEKEMETRFGEAYLEYRRRTPFIIPRLW
jgi:protein-S-isoprenylcysteine O-methyltransferase Ste14